MKASIAQINRQILGPIFPCVVLLISYWTSSFKVACEIPAQLFRHQLYKQVCAHLYSMVPTISEGPQILLSTTTTCFSKLIACIFWCPSCGQNLIQFVTRCCPAASSVSLTFTFAEHHNSLPRNAHEHCNDLLKHCMHIFTRRFQVFGLLHGGGAASLGHIFKIHLSPDHSS
jgi:hypothetical protein